MEAEQATFNGHPKWGPPGLKGVGSTVVQFTSVLRSLPCDQAKNTLSLRPRPASLPWEIMAPNP